MYVRFKMYVLDYIFNRLDTQALGTGREEKEGFCPTRLANEWLIICSSVDSSVGGSKFKEIVFSVKVLTKICIFYQSDYLAAAKSSNMWKPLRTTKACQPDASIDH